MQPALSGLAKNIQCPWVLIEDFNTILEEEDRIMGSPMQDSEVKDFANFLKDNGLTEMKIVGRKYTWSNGHVFSKIDRAVVNAEWLQLFLHIEAVTMDPGVSDHTPITFIIDDNQPVRKKTFKFFNALADHPSFSSAVMQAWKTPASVKHMSRI